MHYNRSALKRSVKPLIYRGNPAPALVTLVFLLATTWVSNIISLFLTDPVDEMLLLTADFTAVMSEAEIITPAMVEAFSQQVVSAFTGPGAMFALLVSLILGFYTMGVNLGSCGYALKVMRGEEGSIGDLFSNFYMAGKIILLQILKILFVYLWSLLFVIPGLIALYRYRMAEYCLLDDPDISALEAIRRSKKLMRGKKFDFFVTELSFIGWALLQIVLYELIYAGVYGFTGDAVVAGFAGLAVDTVVSMFLLTYQNLTYAGFYLFLLGPEGKAGAQPTAAIEEGKNPFTSDDPWGNTPSDGDDEGWNR